MRRVVPAFCDRLAQCLGERCVWIASCPKIPHNPRAMARRTLLKRLHPQNKYRRGLDQSSSEHRRKPWFKVRGPTPGVGSGGDQSRPRVKPSSRKLGCSGRGLVDLPVLDKSIARWTTGNVQLAPQVPAARTNSPPRSVSGRRAGIECLFELRSRKILRFSRLGDDGIHAEELMRNARIYLEHGLVPGTLQLFPVGI